MKTKPKSSPPDAATDLLETMARWRCPNCLSFYTAPRNMPPSFSSVEKKGYRAENDMTFRGRCQIRRCHSCKKNYRFERE